MRLFLTPTDVLFFRGALPFTAGEDANAQSIFPPTPETMQGMLRALIASCWAPTLAEAFAKPEVRELVGDRRSYGRFRLTTVTIGRERDGRVERLFPAPSHLQRLRQEGNQTAGELIAATPVLLRPDTASRSGSADSVTNLPEGMQPIVAPNEAVASGAVIEPFDTWLTEDELSACLRTTTTGIVGAPASDIYTIEPRVGIGLRSASKTVEDGLFYQAAMVRMKPGYGLVVDFELAAVPRPSGSLLPAEQIVQADLLQEVLRLPSTGWYQLGGERRIVRYKVVRDAHVDIHRSFRTPAQRPLLYLATPTYFTKGWRPESWETTFGSLPVAAVIPHIQRIGGWSLDPGNAGGASKPLRRCVPAGSVYFFGQPLTVPGPYGDYGTEIGYGYALEGGW